jgi:ABC-2 type transport system permease protein
MKLLRRSVAVMRKEVRQLRRDRLTAGMIVGVPALQLVLFGYAINQDVRHLRAGVADAGGSQRARILLADAEASQVVDVVARVSAPAELQELLRQGRISVGVVIPPDFERRSSDAERLPAQLLIDASDPTILRTARGLERLPLDGASATDVQRWRRSSTFETLPLYNPENRSEVFIVPGLLGVILTLTMVLFTSVAIVRERERGNLELLINTPIRRIELMVGKIVPYVAIGLVQVSIILGLGSVLFRLPMRGSLLDLYLATGIFIAATLTLGLLISTVARSQFQAFQLTIFFFLPSILLSGFMFPFEGMPRVAQGIAELLPLTHLNRLIRGIVLRGATLGELRAEIWPLVVFFTVTMTAAVLRFRKRLD